MGCRGRRVLAVLLVAFGCCGSRAQSGQSNLPVFDVASVRQNKSEDQQASANVPMGPGAVFVPTGGVFSAKNLPLMVYLMFAYRPSDAEVEALQKQLPEWVLRDRFDVEARTEKTDANKDELRQMVRSMLTERFGLQIHTESRQVAVYRLVQVTPGVMAAGLRHHPKEMDCSPTGKEMKAEWPEAVTGGFPRICGAVLGLPAKEQGNYRLGGSNIPVSLLADSFGGWGGLGKPIVDGTGFAGKIDFVMEFASANAPDRDAEGSGPSFQDALKGQLGLRLEAGRAAVEFLVVDHIGRLVEN